jgi:hypothetical protein
MSEFSEPETSEVVAPEPRSTGRFWGAAAALLVLLVGVGAYAFTSTAWLESSQPRTAKSLLR